MEDIFDREVLQNLGRSDRGRSNKRDQAKDKSKQTDASDSASPSSTSPSPRQSPSIPDNEEASASTKSAILSKRVVLKFHTRRYLSITPRGNSSDLSISLSDSRAERDVKAMNDEAEGGQMSTAVFETRDRQSEGPSNSTSIHTEPATIHTTHITHLHHIGEEEIGDTSKSLDRGRLIVPATGYKAARGTIHVVAAEANYVGCVTCRTFDLDQQAVVSRPMIQCDSCNIWVHQYCYGLPETDYDSITWYCPLCKVLKGLVKFRCPCGSDACAEDEPLAECGVCRTGSHSRCIKYGYVGGPLASTTYNILVNDYMCSSCASPNPLSWHMVASAYYGMDALYHPESYIPARRAARAVELRARATETPSEAQAKTIEPPAVGPKKRARTKRTFGRPSGKRRRK